MMMKPTQATCQVRKHEDVNEGWRLFQSIDAGFDIVIVPAILCRPGISTDRTASTLVLGTVYIQSQRTRLVLYDQSTGDAVDL